MHDTSVPKSETPEPLEAEGSKTVAPGRKSLKEAMRQVRLSVAERSDVIVDLREAEVTRLELLYDDMAGLIADLPENDDQFEVTLVPSHPPRLWVDMLAYVTMGRDKHTYQLQRDTRNGREVLSQSTDRADMVDAITDYVAYRLLEREQAFAADKMPASFMQAKQPALGSLNEPQPDSPKPEPTPETNSAPNQTPAPEIAPKAVKIGYGFSALVLSYILGVISTLVVLGAVAYALING